MSAAICHSMGVASAEAGNGLATPLTPDGKFPQFVTSGL